MGYDYARDFGEMLAPKPREPESHGVEPARARRFVEAMFGRRPPAGDRLTPS